MNATKSEEFSTPEKAAAVGTLYVKELFPVATPESDMAAKLRLELMTEIAAEVGPENFLRAVRKAISLSRSRYDCTIRKIRECAGLPVEPESPAAVAWSLVTRVFEDHCRLSWNGTYCLEEKVVIAKDGIKVTEVPEVPEAAMRVIRGLGGWGALADRSAWSYRFRDFKELYQHEAGPRPGRGGELALISNGRNEK